MKVGTAMKKVMFMINSLNGGGAEKVLQTLLTNLDYCKYDVTLYSMHRENIAELDYPSQIHYKVVFDRYAGKNALWRRVRQFTGKVKGKLFTNVPSKLFYSLFSTKSMMLKLHLLREKVQRSSRAQPIGNRRNMLGFT